MKVKKYLQMVYSSRTRKKFPRTLLVGSDDYLYFASERYVGENMVYVPGSNGLWIAIVKKGSRAANKLLGLGIEVIPNEYLERTIRIGA